MSTLIPGLGLHKTIDEFDSFREVRNVDPATVSRELIGTVRGLDEREEL